MHGWGICSYVEDSSPLALGDVQPGVPVPGFLCHVLYPNQADFGIALSMLRVRVYVFLAVLRPY